MLPSPPPPPEAFSVTSPVPPTWLIVTFVPAIIDVTPEPLTVSSIILPLASTAREYVAVPVFVPDP